MTIKAFFRAIKNNNLQEIKGILEAGLDPNSLNANGGTLLHTATLLRSDRLVALLLNHGANPNVVDSTGDTPLHRAALLSSDRLVALLLNHGANPNVVDANGNTPLHRAATLLNDAVIKLLLKNGAQPDCVDNSGNTPLHYASLYYSCRISPDQPDKKDHSQTIKILLENGANPNCLNNSGSTPLSYFFFSQNIAYNRNNNYTFKKNDEAIMNLLIDNGTDVNIPSLQNNEVAKKPYIRNMMIERAEQFNQSYFSLNKAINDGTLCIWAQNLDTDRRWTIYRKYYLENENQKIPTLADFQRIITQNISEQIYFNSEEVKKILNLPTEILKYEIERYSPGSFKKIYNSLFKWIEVALQHNEPHDHDQEQSLKKDQPSADNKHIKSVIDNADLTCFIMEYVGGGCVESVLSAQAIVIPILQNSMTAEETKEDIAPQCHEETKEDTSLIGHIDG